MGFDRAVKHERRSVQPETAGAKPAGRRLPGLAGMARSLNGDSRVASLSALHQQLNARSAPVQMTRFATAPRFQNVFTTRTGLQGIVLGAGRDRRRPSAAGHAGQQAPHEQELPGRSPAVDIEREPPAMDAAEEELQDLELPGDSSLVGIDDGPPAAGRAAQEDAEEDPQDLELPGHSSLVDIEQGLPSHSSLVPIDMPSEEAFGPPSGERLHADAVNTLGEPVNKVPSAFHELDEETSRTVSAGNDASMRILNEVMRRRGIDPDAADGRQLLIHHAAVGQEAGIGVCDTFGALDAINARLGGHGQVRTTGNMGHRYAVVGDEVVDPWNHVLHRGLRENQVIGGDTHLTQEDPATLARDFAQERAAVRDVLPAVLGEDLAPEERDAYRALLALRQQPGGYGTMAARHAANAREVQDRARREAARAERRRLLEA